MNKNIKKNENMNEKLILNDRFEKKSERDESFSDFLETIFGRPEKAKKTKVKKDFLKPKKERQIKEPTENKKKYNKSMIPKILRELKKKFVGFDRMQKDLKKMMKLLLDNSGIDRKEGSPAQNIHISFSCLPGNGSKIIAAYMGQLLCSLGYLSKGHVTTVTKENLIGSHIGQTAVKTKDLFKKAHGGILLLDQCSNMKQGESSNTFSKEVIELLLQVMEKDVKDLVIIFVDEDTKLKEFLAMNSGLASRVGYHLSFPNFTPDELAKALAHFLYREGKFFVAKEAHARCYFFLMDIIKSENFENIKTIRKIASDLIDIQTERLVREGKLKLKKDGSRPKKPTLKDGVAMDDVLSIESSDITECNLKYFHREHSIR